MSTVELASLLQSTNLLGYTGSQGAIGYTGSASSGGSTGLTLQTIQTANFTAITGNVYPIDTRLSPITITLPNNPSTGDIVGFID